MDEFNTNLDKAKEGINKLEDRSEENIQTEIGNKRMENILKNLRDIQKKKKRSLLSKAQKEKRERMDLKQYLKILIAKNYLKLTF